MVFWNTSNTDLNSQTVIVTDLNDGECYTTVFSSSLPLAEFEFANYYALPDPCLKPHYWWKQI